MTLEQAMDMVVKATGEFRGNRQDHAVITEALQVLHKELFQKDVVEEPSEPCSQI
jgi:hypothetical protein